MMAGRTPQFSRKQDFLAKNIEIESGNWSIFSEIFLRRTPPNLQGVKHRENACLICATGWLLLDHFRSYLLYEFLYELPASSLQYLYMEAIRLNTVKYGNVFIQAFFVLSISKF